MNLRDQMAADMCQILTTNELGEVATWTPNGTTNAMTRTLMLIEQPERQTIRRAHIWTQHSITNVSAGDLFRVKRKNVTTTWRVQFTDPAQTGIQRSYCHLQLNDTCVLWDRRFQTSERGASTPQPPTGTTSVRCQWFESGAEIDVTQRQRRMQLEKYLLLETLPELTTAQTVEDSSGRFWRVERMEKPFSRSELPYLVCTRVD